MGQYTLVKGTLLPVWKIMVHLNGERVEMHQFLIMEVMEPEMENFITLTE